MLINEIFDSPYTLKTDTEQTKEITTWLRSQGHGLNGLIVYEAADEPSQVFILIKSKDGFWEVHHVHVTKHGYQSGEFINGGNNQGANPRFISTAMMLYQKRLDKGHGIRIVAKKDSGMWKTYKKVIDRIVKNSNGGLLTGPIDDNFMSIDGVPSISQTIKNKGKFHETFKNFRSKM
jgi:hypothetical protein